MCGEISGEEETHMPKPNTRIYTTFHLTKNIRVCSIPKFDVISDSVLAANSFKVFTIGFSLGTVKYDVNVPE